MSTLFIALQCCQCSTMQVKQKKKSSNKWTCALCNKNQSLRKVFAQGYQAKDIRIFVQSFNASRNSLQQQWLLAGTLNSTPEHALGDSKFPTDLNHNNKRTDWTAYLDNDDHHAANIAEQHDDDFEPLVVTELPKDMFKKRRLVDNSKSGSDRHFEKPTFQNSQGEPEKDQRRITVSIESNSERRNIKVTQKCKQTVNSSASKWNDYLTEDNDYLTEDSDNLELGCKRGFNFKDPSVSWNNDILEAITCEQRVEDDIHPDFM
ncbi:uncharacterized protein [Cicer arietinum]|uniref:MRN complex-interacting protein isoform X2 n=1 Tax=Cicer arietinum TaxID=3827 RepID=A0A1S2XIL5_CICAR|nr:MRN complex-interacting protein isoform X2 [Cicer arietinum]